MTARVTIAFFFLLAVSTASTAQDQGPPPSPTLDHFECYYSPSGVFQTQVQLSDLFDLARGEVTWVADLRVGRLCTPVMKTHAGRSTKISNPAAHLTVFQLAPQPIVPRQVWINNQFGSQQLALRDAVALAAPTGAEPIVPGTEPVGSLPIPPGLDHFKCYNASGRPIRARVELRDRFRSGNARVLEPIAFCNPVEKKRLDTLEVVPITNAKDHLTCYTHTPMPLSDPFVVLITNQFGTGRPSIDGSDALCVPTVLHKWYELTPLTPRE